VGKIFEINEVLFYKSWKNLWDEKSFNKINLLKKWFSYLKTYSKTTFIRSNNRNA